MLEVQWHIPNSCRKLFDKSLRQIEVRLLRRNQVSTVLYNTQNNINEAVHLLILPV